MKNNLYELGLNSNNSIVIGSGILKALKIRQSKDIDLVVTFEVYNFLKRTGKFRVTENHSREILVNNKFEIGTNWVVLGKSYEFKDFMKDSLIIDGIRYITLDFLYEAKKSWLEHADVRPKDIKDVELIENYLKK